jgi:uncharacterized protein YaaW (UPF0174 family)
MVVRTKNALESLYEADETAWLEQMAELVREGRYEELDYSHLQEYLTEMAIRERRRIESRLAVLLEHLLKWRFQQEKRSRSWHRTVLVQQQAIADDVAKGVLRNHALEVLPRAYSRAVKLAAVAIGLPPETFPPASPFTLDEAMTLDLADA